MRFEEVLFPQTQPQQRAPVGGQSTLSLTLPFDGMSSLWKSWFKLIKSNRALEDLNGKI
jgi:hypothetical protein